MDGRILASSLTALQGHDLRMVYALLCRTNIGHLLTSKTKDLFSKEEQDHFTKHLAEEVRKLSQIEDCQLQVDLFLEITKLLRLRGTKYTLQREIEDQCTLIVNEVYAQFLKQDKQFKAFAEAATASTKLQQMIQFQMSKIFSQLDDSFQHFSIEDQEKFAAQVAEYISSLPEEKQSKIKEKLGINDLTNEMVRKAIAASGTSIVFAIIVEVSGFAFYTTATSLVAGFAGLFGLTLPFGFYTGLTSTIAVLANPLFFIPLLLGGGVLLVNYQNKSLKTKLLPIIMMQIALPYMSSGGELVRFDLFIQEWEWRFREYCRLHDRIENNKQEQQSMTVQIRRAEAKIEEYKEQVDAGLRKIRMIKNRIKAVLAESNLDLLAVSPSFTLHKNQYQRTEAKILELQDTNRNRPVESGFFNMLGAKFKQLSTSLDIRAEEKKLDTLLELMVTDVLESESIFQNGERNQIKQIEQHLAIINASKSKEEAEKKRLEEILRGLRQEHHAFSQQFTRMQKENYGLADLLTS